MAEGKSSGSERVKEQIRKSNKDLRESERFMQIVKNYTLYELTHPTEFIPDEDIEYIWCMENREYAVQERIKYVREVEAQKEKSRHQKSRLEQKAESAANSIPIMHSNPGNPVPYNPTPNPNPNPGNPNSYSNPGNPTSPQTSLTDLLKGHKFTSYGDVREKTQQCMNYLLQENSTTSGLEYRALMELREKVCSKTHEILRKIEGAGADEKIDKIVSESNQTLSFIETALYLTNIRKKDDRVKKEAFKGAFQEYLEGKNIVRIGLEEEFEEKDGQRYVWRGGKVFRLMGPISLYEKMGINLHLDRKAEEAAVQPMPEKMPEREPEPVKPEAEELKLTRRIRRQTYRVGGLGGLARIILGVKTKIKELYERV